MKYSTSFILLFLGISGCTKELKVDFGEPTKKIVLYPYLTNNKKITIKMSGPTSILSNEFPILENGLVVISDDEVPVDTVIINTAGKGSSKIIPIPGHKYSFKATADGYPDAVCEAILPDPVKELNVDTSYLYLQRSKLMKARLKIKDDPNKINYYKVTVNLKRYITTTIVTRIGNTYVTHDTSYISISKPQLYANIPDMGFFYYPTGKFILAQDEIDFGDSFAYKYELGSETYFQGSEFYFPDDLFNGKELVLDVLVGFEIKSTDPAKYIIELSTISEDYYMGVKSYARYGTKENANLPLSEEVSIYSAVKGGYGFPLSSSAVIDSSYWMPRY